MKRILALFIIFVLAFLSCAHLEREEIRKSSDEEGVISMTKAPLRLGGQFLNNPYHLETMQMASDSLCLINNLPRLILNPTDVYVRFLPKDSLEYNEVLSLGTELFDFPLTYDPDTDVDSYRDPSVPDTLITWQYTTVPYGVTMPDVEYEVLDTCYIPLPSRSMPIEGFDALLEDLASRIANPSLGYSDNSFQAGHNRTTSAYPSGRVTVEMDGNTVPLRGVQVKAWYFVKTATGYTDDDGYYYLTRPFTNDSQYSVVFTNQIGFSEYDGELSATPAWSKWLRHPKEGYDIHIASTDSQHSWFAAAINNRVVEYFDLCDYDGRQAPPADLRILVLDSDGQGSGAPMLKHIGYSEIQGLGLTYNQLVYGLLHFVAPLTSILYSIFKYALPDIVFLTQPTEADLHMTVFHEMSHASHYACAGSSVWLDVIAHTVRSSWPTDQGYGNGTINDAAQNACELAEAWAYACHRKIQLDNNYNPNTPIAGSTWWFAPSVQTLYDIVERNLLGADQVLDEMNAYAGSMDDLWENLSNSYPSKLIWITNVFAENLVLAHQTVWRILNDSSESLIFSIREGNIVKHTVVNPNEYFTMSSIPFTNKSFYATWYQCTNYNPDEFFIRKSNTLSVIYHQTGNGNVITPLNRTFYSSQEWDHYTDTTTAGNNMFTLHTFTLTDSDF